MSDDRKSKKYVEGDVERVSKSRPATNVPSEIDPEETPPPREPIDITKIPNFEKLSEPLREALITLHNTQREHDLAFLRLWDTRDVGHELEALTETTQAAVGKLDQIGTITALLHKYDVQLQLLIDWRKQAEKRETRTVQILDALDKRFDVVERDYMKLDSSMLALAKQVTDGFAIASKGVAELQRELDELKKDHSARITSLEHTRTSANAKISAIAAIAAMLVTLVAWILNKVWK